MQLVGNGKELLKPSYNDVLRGVGLIVVVVVEHLGTCIEQEEAKQTQNPLETLHHCCASKNKDAA